MELENMSKKEMDKIICSLWELKASLIGFASLFQGGCREMDFEDEELFGIGQLLKKLSEDVAHLHDSLLQSTLKPRTKNKGKKRKN